MSGTTISGARPVPLITERRWISERAEHLAAAPADNPLAIHVLAVARNASELSACVSCQALALPLTVGRSPPFRSLLFRRDASAIRIQSFFRGFFFILFYFGAEARVAPFFGAELALRDKVGEAPDAAKPALSGVTPFFSLSPVTTTSLFFFKTAC